jgi:hypothetical protein
MNWETKDVVGTESEIIERLIADAEDLNHRLYCDCADAERKYKDWLNGGDRRARTAKAKALYAAWEGAGARKDLAAAVMGALQKARVYDNKAFHLAQAMAWMRVAGR